MRLNRLVRTGTFQFSMLYAVVFGTSVLILSGIVYWNIHAALERQCNARVALESATLESLYQSDNVEAFRTLLDEREKSGNQGQFSYLLATSDRRHLQGTLNLSPFPALGWSTLSVPGKAGGETQYFRVLTIALPGGLSLSVGRNLSFVRDAGDAVLKAFAWGLAATVFLALAGGLFVSSRFLSRVDSMTSAAEAIIDGNLRQRLPVHKTDDELDFLALTFNRMLDRITELMEGMRQVSNDVAHDLRTPLARLRHRLEAASDANLTATDLRLAISGAIKETDDILGTFSALMRIAQIEAGSRRSAFTSINLSQLVAEVADAFAPSIEDQNMSLRLSIEPGVLMVGDKELLTQLLANLLENVLRHTPAGTAIGVELRNVTAGIELVVSDNGPGVPVADRAKLFDRFYRPEKSRTTPGNGLGLSLVKAIANLHGASATLADNQPGLRVRLEFAGKPVEGCR